MPSIFTCAKCGAVANPDLLRPGEPFTCLSCGQSSEVYVQHFPDSIAPPPGPTENSHAPLTSEDFSSIFSQTFRLCFGPLWVMFPLSLAYVIPVTLYADSLSRKMQAMIALADTWLLLRTMLIGMAGFFLIVTIIHAFVASTMCLIVTDQFLNRPVRVLKSFLDSVMRVPTVLAAGLLMMAGTMLIGITIIGLPVAIYLGLTWCFYLPSAVLRGTGPIQSLSRSFELVRGYWWRVLAVFFVIGMTCYLIVLIPSIIAAFLPAPWNTVVSILCTTLITACSSVGSVLVFTHLRVRRQSLTLDQLALERDALAA